MSLFSCVVWSQAAAQLSITDGVSTYTVTDNSPQDGNTNAGSFQVSPPFDTFPGWSFILVNSVSKPALGSTNRPFIDVNWLVKRDDGAGSNALTIAFSDQGFNLATPTLWRSAVGGVIGGQHSASNGSVAIFVDHSTNNVLFGSNLLSGSSLFAAGPGSFSSNSPTGLLPAGSSNSFTLQIILGQGTGVITAGDYLFQADVPVPPGGVLLTNGFRFRFFETPGTVFQALASTNVAAPLSNWTVLGPVTEFAPGGFEFTDSDATNHAHRFYQVRSP
jgi:hypothetical protein